MTRTLLLDADILAYQASSANQRAYDWNGDGTKSVAADEAEARRFAEEAIMKIADTLQADDVIVCLSDDFNNFRKDRVDPTYKAARSKVDRPVHLYDIKDWLAETYTTERWTALEADDVMGIIATDPNRTDERIIVSDDKDLQGVPGKLVQPRRGFGIQHITPAQADNFHLYQTIVGDIVDGYPGLRGAGPVEAEKLLTAWGWSSYHHTFQNGPRKGEAEWRWVRYQFVSPWNAIVSAYQKAGLTEADAIRQARLARILRYEDWDGRSPRLWNPPN